MGMPEHVLRVFLPPGMTQQRQLLCAWQHPTCSLQVRQLSHCCGFLLALSFPHSCE